MKSLTKDLNSTNDVELSACLEVAIRAANIDLWNLPAATGLPAKAGFILRSAAMEDKMSFGRTHN